jgi:hypothetical protein
MAGTHRLPPASAFDVLAGATVTGSTSANPTAECSFSACLTDDKVATNDHIFQQTLGHTPSSRRTAEIPLLEGGTEHTSLPVYARDTVELQQAHTRQAPTGPMGIHSHMHAAHSLKNALKHIALQEALREETSFSSTNGCDRRATLSHIVHAIHPCHFGLTEFL